jgi:exosortase C (VPDSG-CTERM-specific)
MEPIGQPKTAPASATGRWHATPLRRLALGVLLVALVFAKPLFDLAAFARDSDLYSHMLLVPFISGFFFWWQRRSIAPDSPAGDEPTGPADPPPAVAAPSRWVLLPLLLGVAGSVGYVLGCAGTLGFHPVDQLALAAFSLVCLIWSVAAWSLGAQSLRALWFPFAFLVFLIPFPISVRNAIELFLVHASAETANLLFHLLGTSFEREGLIFRFPGLAILVDQECSGIRSSFILFITALMAGQLLLNSPWKRALLAALVIPLGILRNAIRIGTLVVLTLHVDPNALHSPIHTRGGPVFFLLSLVPFVLILAWLRKRDRNMKRKKMD